MAVQNDTQLAAAAAVIRDETVASANTAVRVGGLLADLSTNKINIDKISTNIATDTGSNTKVPTVAAVQAAILGSGVTTVKVSLTSAEILALFTTPKVLVAAPGAGKFIRVLAITGRSTYGTLTYSGGVIRVAYNVASSTVFTSNFYTASSDSIAVKAPSDVLFISSDIVNQPLTANVATSNPTTGDGTADLYITYSIITL